MLIFSHIWVHYISSLATDLTLQITSLLFKTKVLTNASTEQSNKSLIFYYGLYAYNQKEKYYI